MAYTPINWQSGDIISAERMNKMDNGWNYGIKQLFNETINTVLNEDNHMFVAIISSQEEFIDFDIITVIFDEVNYTVSKYVTSIGENAYGAIQNGQLDFTNCPFVILTSSGQPYSIMILTETAGTHTITAMANGFEISNNFKTVVNKCVDLKFLPMPCIPELTTYQEMVEAFQKGRLLYFQFERKNYIITSFDQYSVDFSPDALLSTSFQNDIFIVSSEDIQ